MSSEAMQSSNVKKPPQRTARRRRTGKIFALAVVALSFSLGVDSAYAERRVALVMGNAAYQNAPRLRTPPSDAAKVADLLRTLDFSVVVLTDVDKIGMEVAIRRFSAEINGADVALFYYSGHAAQVGDVNYIVPVSAKIDGARSLTLDTIALQDVSSSMRQAGAKVQLLFLDACRDNPFENAFSPPQAQGASRGLAKLTPANGSLIVFSTSPGDVAHDGLGVVSPFTDGFLRYAATPNIDIRQMLSRVRAYVKQQTNDVQVPWDNSSLLGDFYLVPKRPPPTFDKLAQVELSQDAAAQPLRLKAPTQPEGGAVDVKIEHAPSHGHLVLGALEIADNAVLSAADFARVAYESDSPNEPDSFSYRVSDVWGNSDLGLVSISRNSAKGPSLEAQALATPPLEHTAINISASAVSLIGLGPNLVYHQPLPVPSHSAGQKLQLASDAPFGQILLGDRVIEKGRSLDIADLSHLSFEAPPGTEGKHTDALFTLADGSNGEVKIGIDVQETECDRLAGDKFDAQGVAKGVLLGRIDAAAALPSCELAIKARPNSGRFNYQIGRVYAALGRDSEAVAAFHKAADLGYIRAQWALGYHDIYVPPVNYERGKEELEKAAASGDVYAIQSLGQMYYEGRGIAKDLEKARGLFEIAARRGHTFAMNSLGRMYQRGETVPANPELARRYWEESAARGDIYGIDNLGWAALEGVGGDKDPAKAMKYFKQAYELGHPEAPTNIGRLYFMGVGVPVDFAEARRWYTIAADRGDAWGALNLGDLVMGGKGGASDNAQAGYYYARAAAAVNRLEPAEQARQRLAAMAPKDKAQALRLLLRDVDPNAAAQGDPAASAQRVLSQKGIKVSNDSPDALLIGVAQAAWLARTGRADLF
jgi:TPR repeat protein